MAKGYQVKAVIRAIEKLEAEKQAGGGRAGEEKHGKK
jgi:hypothetical protein